MKGKAKKKRPRSKPSSREGLVRKALRLIERRMDEDEINSSLADLIRLLEVTKEEPHEVRAGWLREGYKD